MSRFVSASRRFRSLVPSLQLRTSRNSPMPKLQLSAKAASSATAQRHASNITSIFSKETVPPIGPYSHAIKANGLVWLSGQIPGNNKGELIEGTTAEKTHQMCKNTRAVLEAAGSRLENVVKVTVFFENFDDFAEMNAVYAEYFPHRPARSACEVTRLPLGASMAMDVIALE